MKQFILLLIFSITILSIKAQNVGDTVFVHSFNYSQTHGHVWDGTIRDTNVMFPTNTSLSYSKVIMEYSIRCKNGLVSPAVSGQTNIGCGEWDYSCNTYIHGSARVDSFKVSHSNYSIANFSGTSFNYVATPMNAYYQYIQPNVVVNGTPADTQSTVGTGSAQTNDLIQSGTYNAKRQYLFTASELIAAGVSAGNIDAIALDVASGNANARFFTIKLKSVADTVLQIVNPNNSGFTEVYFHNSTLVSGSNNFQFHSPFLWDGSSSIIVEYSYYNKQASSAISFNGSILSQNRAMITDDDNSFTFDGANYIECDNYKGISGTTERTVEAWIKTTVADKEIVSWGDNQGGEKWVFRINGGGQLRVEVNGGSIYGSTLLNDDIWHHVACTFQGNSVNDIKLYVDGVLELNPVIANKVINTDTANGINLRISRGINDRYFNGLIDEVRLWDKQLSQTELQNWMNADLDNSHPEFAHLQLHYKLDDLVAGGINDNSIHQRNAHSVNGGELNTIKGSDLFKDWKYALNRPNTTFLQGNYILTITNDTVIDTLMLPTNNIKEYQIVSHAGSINSDEVVVAMDTNLWQAGDEYTYDAITGSVVNTQTRTADGTFTFSDLTYYKRQPMKFEIMSFVTPYGINLDLGPEGKTFTYDVTDYMPMLKGNKRMTVEGGGQWQEDMDITFAFIVGTPARDVLDIQQIWPVQAKNNADILADKAFEPRDVLLDANAKYFKIRSAITGHGGQGEFISRQHSINIDGGSTELSWMVWKNDCGLNPIYPQGGTWIYDRAGWCPGASTNIEQNDITAFVTPGQLSTIDYSMQSATGDSRYIVNNQLVTYGDINFEYDVAVIDIMNPSSKIEHARENYICNNPTVVIENTGSAVLTSAVIEYWVNDASQPLSYTWNGQLNFGESTEVTLTANQDLWNSLQPGVNNFHVKVSSPNGNTDEYEHNNLYHSTFKIPDVMPDEFIIFLRTNHAGGETSYKLSNTSGVILEKNNLESNKFYRDTVHLGVGCYKLEVFDTDGDGLKFFANNDGSGYIRFRKLNNQYLKNFQADFGRKMVYNFTVNYPLSYEQTHAMEKTTMVYPNPNNGSFNIKFAGQNANKIIVSDMLGKLVLEQDITTNDKLIRLDLGVESNGMYMVQILFDDKVEQHKIIVE